MLLSGKGAAKQWLRNKVHAIFCRREKKGENNINHSRYIRRGAFTAKVVKILTEKAKHLVE